MIKKVNKQLNNRLNISKKLSIKNNMYLKYDNPSASTTSVKQSQDKSYSNPVGIIKHFPPASKEWCNSVYAYNSNTIKTLPSLTNSLFKLVRGYFNLYDKKLINRVKKSKSRRVEVRKARLSLKKIMVSNPELKHTNDKTIITVYIYNAEKKYYLNKLKKMPDLLKRDEFIIKETSETGLNLRRKLQDHKKSFFITKHKGSKLNKNIFTTEFNRYQKNYMKNFIYRFLRKEIISIYYKQLLAFNKSKFDKKYVLLLVNEIHKIYNKNVELNFVNLKYLYLDSYMFSTALVTKVKKLIRLKKSFLMGLKKSLNMLNIPPTNPLDVYNEMYNKKMIAQNVNLNNDMSRTLQIDENQDIIDKSLTRYLSEKKSSYNKQLGIYNENYLTRLVQVFKSTKYKFLNGVRIEIAGRLSRRKSATRSVFKIRNKGNIRNRDSSDKGLSAVMLRGHAKSNLQYNKLYSKAHGGSFGFKGWVSGA